MDMLNVNVTGLSVCTWLCSILSKPYFVQHV